MVNQPRKDRTVTLQISSLTKEYVKTTVTTSVGAAVTGDIVEFAFPQEFVAPVAGDWDAGAWVAGTSYDARILVGPGTSVVLAPGGYDCWVRVTDNPEIPVRKFDTLYVNA